MMRAGTESLWAKATWAAYERSPAFVDTLVKWYRPYSRPWRTWRVPVEILTGPIDSLGHQGSIAIAGTRPWVDYWAFRFFEGEPRREFVGHVSLLSLSSYLRSLGSSVDLTIARVDRISARFFFDQSFLTVPEIVGLSAPVPSDPSQIGCDSRAAKNEIRIIRKKRYTWEVSTQVSDCDDFRENFHASFMRKRHGDRAMIQHVRYLRRMVRRGGIIWVLRDGQRIAGSVFELRKDVLHRVGTGVLDKLEDQKRSKVMAAISYYSFLFAHQQGYSQVEFGGALPALTDGLLRFKVKWGAGLDGREYNATDFYIRWSRFGDPVLEFLRKIVPIFRKGGRLSALTVAPADLSPTADGLRKFCKNLKLPGLDRLYICSPKGWNDADEVLRTLGSDPAADHDCRIVLCDRRDLNQAIGIKP